MGMEAWLRGCVVGDKFLGAGIGDLDGWKDGWMGLAGNSTSGVGLGINRNR
jgi:hypothetical protein